MGDRVWATYRTDYSVAHTLCVYPGTVTQIHNTPSDLSYDIEFDDGDIETKKNRKDIFRQIRKNMTMMWSWQHEVGEGLWEDLDHATQAKIWTSYHQCTTKNSPGVEEIEIAVGTLSLYVQDPNQRDTFYTNIEGKRVNVRLKRTNIYQKKKKKNVKSCELVPGHAVLLNFTGNEVDMYTQEMWRSRDMIELKGSIVNGCVLSLQKLDKKKNKKKRKKYLDYHRDTISVLPLYRVDYQEYPSSDSVTDTNNLNLPPLSISHHSRDTLDLYIRQLWNLRVSSIRA